MACLLPALRTNLALRLAPRPTLRLSTSTSTYTWTQDIPRTDATPVVVPTTPSTTPQPQPHQPQPTPTPTPTASTQSTQSTHMQMPSPPKPPRPKLRPAKAAISLTPAAVARLRVLMSGPAPRHLRIGVRNKGCAGMQYHLEYVDAPGQFDETVSQDGVSVLVDSKALFSIIGSEMDWVEDRLSAKFAFKNPNVKDACGCGESFAV